MSEWDQFILEESKNASPSSGSEWDQFVVEESIPETSEASDSEIGRAIKGLARGTLSWADLPQNILGLLQTATSAAFPELATTDPNFNINSLPPLSETLTGGMLNPNDVTDEERLRSAAYEGAGSFISGGIGGKALNAASKAPGLAKFLGSEQGIANLATTGAATGATMKALEDNPVAAMAAPLVVGSAANLGSKGLKAFSNKNIAGRQLRNAIGKDNVENVLPKLADEEMFGIKPTTAELAGSAGIQKLYKKLRSQGSEIIANRENANNAALQEVVPELHSELKNLKSAYGSTTHGVKAKDPTQIELPEFEEFLVQKKILAPETNLKTIRDIEKELGRKLSAATAQKPSTIFEGEKRYWNPEYVHLGDKKVPKSKLSITMAQNLLKNNPEQAASFFLPRSQAPEFSHLNAPFGTIEQARKIFSKKSLDNPLFGEANRALKADIERAGGADYINTTANLINSLEKFETNPAFKGFIRDKKNEFAEAAKNQKLNKRTSAENSYKKLSPKEIKEQSDKINDKALKLESVLRRKELMNAAENLDADTIKNPRFLGNALNTLNNIADSGINVASRLPFGRFPAAAYRWAGNLEGKPRLNNNLELALVNPSYASELLQKPSGMSYIPQPLPLQVSKIEMEKEHRRKIPTVRVTRPNNYEEVYGKPFPTVGGR